MTMQKQMVIQGRHISIIDIKVIRKLIKKNPSWKRTRVSKELCKKWNWYTPYGQMKDMACRTLLLKLERSGHITLPPSQNPKINSYRNKQVQYALHSSDPIQTELKTLMPVHLEVVSEKQHLGLFKTFISLYHYLGYSGTVGENIKYMAFDRRGNPLGCFLFGSAAWKVEPRDSFIGWDAKTRERNLPFITNNMRFLLLPWVRVKHLASHLLGKVARRISDDWIEKYKHPIHLLETFIEQSRFTGISYKAANWIFVGQTKGRTRNDRHTSIHVPIKGIYLYPLSKTYREELLS
ncbi:MAG TPA: DUF4338 domain-containing protein [Candidatus Aminicenantes bacterium]|nr:DUF4338 domain-containing protein [Candidatus Aminicenantes bacterium]